MKEGNEENKKYYFITYHFITDLGRDIIENEIIDYHPLKFLKEYNGEILFYKEISKELFEEYKDFKKNQEENEESKSI